MERGSELGDQPRRNALILEAGGRSTGAKLAPRLRMQSGDPTNEGAGLDKVLASIHLRPVMAQPYRTGTEQECALTVALDAFALPSANTRFSRTPAIGGPSSEIHQFASHKVSASPPNGQPIVSDAMRGQRSMLWPLLARDRRPTAAAPMHPRW
jgi:hypothetical protein